MQETGHSFSVEPSASVDFLHFQSCIFIVDISNPYDRPVDEISPWQLIGLDTMLVEEHLSFRLGRKMDLADEQQSSSVLSRLTPYSVKEQSYLRRETDETSTDDANNDLLIQDTILPHRKRIRKDTYLSNPQPALPTDQSSPPVGITSSPSLEVSRSSFVFG